MRIQPSGTNDDDDDDDDEDEDDDEDDDEDNDDDEEKSEMDGQSEIRNVPLLHSSAEVTMLEKGGG